MEDKIDENDQMKQQKRKTGSLRNILDNMKHNNMCIMGIPEGEESEQEVKNLYEEIMTENFPNL